jgi:hypothetical protein
MRVMDRDYLLRRVSHLEGLIARAEQQLTRLHGFCGPCLPEAGVRGGGAAQRIEGRLAELHARRRAVLSVLE